ncbi:MAG: hypothetical protein JNG88_02610 [Phycisphaerales bacterium]|nr:hypothetical protein [Phycisphaerales bacterium]
MLAVTPWFDPNWFGAMYGAIGGGGGGSLLGLIAPLCMLAAQRGKARGAVMSLWFVLIVVGVSQLALAGFALARQQPFGIWFAPALCGLITTVLSTVFVILAHRAYMQAEARKLDAAALRNS